MHCQCSATGVKNKPFLMTFLIKILENFRNGKLHRHDLISDFMRFLNFKPLEKPDFIGFLAFRYIPTISNEIVQNHSNGHNSKSVCRYSIRHVGSNPTLSAKPLKKQSLSKGFYFKQKNRTVYQSTALFLCA